MLVDWNVFYVADLEYANKRKVPNRWNRMSWSNMGCMSHFGVKPLCLNRSTRWAPEFQFSCYHVTIMWRFINSRYACQ